LIRTIAVKNGVGNGFRQADQNVSMYVWREVVSFCYFMDEWFNSGYILGIRRKGKVRV
jgi:hypothetical protein